MTFAALLRQYRQRAGLSQNALARLASIDPAYVNRSEVGRGQHGRVCIPRAEVVRSLCSALELDRDDAHRLLLAAGYAPQCWQDAVLRYGLRAEWRVA